jgi:hypothetical protein
MDWQIAASISNIVITTKVRSPSVIQLVRKRRKTQGKPMTSVIAEKARADLTELSFTTLEDGYVLQFVICVSLSSFKYSTP